MKNAIQIPSVLALMLSLALFTGCSDDDDTTSPVSDSTVDPGDDSVETVHPYTIVDSGQTTCFDTTAAISCPAAGDDFAGQDSQHAGYQPSYVLSSDGLVVTDLVTGLMWQHSPDTDGDGSIEASDKLSWTEAQAYPAELNDQQYGGYDDWRLPTIKELYSLIMFTGTDPVVEGDDTTGLVPFIDTDAFDFEYGDTQAGERIIDSQYASSTLYVGDSAEGQLLFGVNFADGRIKGYGLTLMGQDKTFFVQCVRGNTDYGVNSFTDNGDGTVSDLATGLMWTQDDSGAQAPDGLTWQQALAWAETMNDQAYLGYSDWRLPNVKELQSIVDYTRSPGTTSSAAIDPVFACTEIINEAGAADYGFYWSSTTHMSATGGGTAGCYVAFGRSLGYMNGSWVDVHGAGSQRSDPKVGDPADYPEGHGPQGDAIRIFNHIRLVRSL